MIRPLIKKQSNKVQPPPILQFQGYYEFLSVDFPCWVYYQGFLFPSVTTAFQAARSGDANIRRKISEVKDQQQLKKYILQIKNTPDWPQRRLKVMQQLNRDKFKRNKELGLKLFATQNRKLVNGYAKGGEAENFWGAIDVKGQLQGLNTLGSILTKIREEIQSNNDFSKWIDDQNVEQNQSLWPIVDIIIEKQDQSVDSIALRSKNKFIFGSGQLADFKLDQKNSSKYHASIYFSTDMEVVLVDLNSVQGVKIDRKGEQIKPDSLRPQSLQNGDVIYFGSSLNRYILDISYEQVQKNINEKQQEVKLELQKIQKIKQLQIQNAQNEQKLIEQQLKQYSCLYVEGINRNFSYKDIRDTFSQYGLTKNIRINIDQKTGRFMGSVLIYYDDKVKISDVLENIKKNPIKFDFRVVAVTSQQAQKIIATFCNKEVQQKQRKQAEQNQRLKALQNEKNREKIVKNEKKKVRGNSSSSSSSNSPSSSNSRSRSRTKKKHDRSHNR